MKHEYCAESSSILIRPLKKGDLEYLRSWRNDEKLSTYLRSIPYITEEAQIKWFDKYLEDKSTLFFSIVDKERKTTVGSVALYNFNKDSCDVGKIIIGDPASHGKGIGYRSLLLAITVAIKQLEIRCFRLDVHEDNIPARNIYEKVGFKVIGKHAFEKGGFELEMEIASDCFFGLNPIAETINVFMEDDMTRAGFANRGGIEP